MTVAELITEDIAELLLAHKLRRRYRNILRATTFAAAAIASVTLARILVANGEGDANAIMASAALIVFAGGRMAAGDNYRVYDRYATVVGERICTAFTHNRHDPAVWDVFDVLANRNNGVINDAATSVRNVRGFSPTFPIEHCGHVRADLIWAGGYRTRANMTRQVAFVNRLGGDAAGIYRGLAGDRDVAGAHATTLKALTAAEHTLTTDTRITIAARLADNWHGTGIELLDAVSELDKDITPAA